MQDVLADLGSVFHQVRIQPQNSPQHSALGIYYYLSELAQEIKPIHHPCFFL